MRDRREEGIQRAEGGGKRLFTVTEGLREGKEPRVDKRTEGLG